MIRRKFITPGYYIQIKVFVIISIKKKHSHLFGCIIILLKDPARVTGKPPVCTLHIKQTRIARRSSYINIIKAIFIHIPNRNTGAVLTQFMRQGRLDIIVYCILLLVVKLNPIRI